MVFCVLWFFLTFINCYITLADFVGCGLIFMVFICFCLVVCEVMVISEVLCT